MPFCLPTLYAADLSELTYTTNGGEAKLVGETSDFPLRRFSWPLKPILKLAEKSISCQ